MCFCPYRHLTSFLLWSKFFLFLFFFFQFPLITSLHDISHQMHERQADLPEQRGCISFRATFIRRNISSSFDHLVVNVAFEKISNPYNSNIFPFHSIQLTWFLLSYSLPSFSSTFYSPLVASLHQKQSFRKSLLLSLRWDPEVKIGLASEARWNLLMLILIWVGALDSHWSWYWDI